MKKLFLLLFIPMTLFSNEADCQTALTLFDYSIMQERPITDEQIMMAIAYCQDHAQYEEIILQMAYMLETTDIQTF